MTQRLRQALRLCLPFPVRRWLAGVRAKHGLPSLFGRLRAGGWSASVSRHASARLWRQVKLGPGCIIDAGAYFHTNDNGDGWRIQIDEGSFVGRNSFFSAGESIHVGPRCNIGASCKLLAAGHAYDDPCTPYSVAPVVSYGSMTLGANAWIGVGSTLVGGVDVGFGSIVAAGSLVRGSLPPLCLAAGTPAAIVKLYDWPSRRWIRMPVPAAEREAILARHLATIPTATEYARLLKH